LQKGDKERLSELFYEAFGDGKGADYWDWKYFQNPAGEHTTMVAFDGARLVGNIGGIPVKMRAGTNTLLASQGVDTVIAPDHRKRTTFFKLEAGVKELMIKNDVCFTYAFSIKETYRIFTQVLRFSGVCPIHKMSKVVNPTPYLQQKLGMGLLTKPLGIAGKQAIARLNKKKISVPAGLRIVEVKHFDRRFDDFWRREASMYEIAVVRDSGYLNWRYIESPTPYKIFCVETDESIKGYIVLGCYQEEVARGRIVDILTQTGEEQIMDLLLAEAINYFIDQKVDVIVCWVLEHWPIFEALRKRGFIQRETPHDLMVRSYVPHLSNEYLADRAKWYISMGDSDYY
jgi:hypothetical protein